MLSKQKGPKNVKYRNVRNWKNHKLDMLLDIMSEAKVVSSLGEVRRRGLSLGRILGSKERAMADSAFHLSRISLAAVGRISVIENSELKEAIT